MWRLSGILCITPVFIMLNGKKSTYNIIDNDCPQRNKVAIVASKQKRNRTVIATPKSKFTPSKPTPMDDVMEQASEDMSHMQIDDNQNNTYNVEHAPSQMKIDW